MILKSQSGEFKDRILKLTLWTRTNKKVRNFLTTSDKVHQTATSLLEL